MVANRQALMSLRLALSRREKALSLAQESKEALTAGHIDKARHDMLQAFYSGHLQSAENRLRDLRQEHAKRIAELDTVLEELQTRQKEVQEGAASGLVRVSEVNRRHRKLAKRIGELKEEAAFERRLVEADSPDAVGGFIDMPLDDYAAEAPSGPAAYSTEEWLFTCVLSLLMPFALLLPWVIVLGVSWRLSDLPAFLEMVGLEEVPETARFVWAVYALLPLVGLPFALWRNLQKSGAWLIVVGAACTGAVVTPLAAIGINPNIEASIDPIQLFAGLRIGSLSYLGGAVLMMLLGARRIRLSKGPLKSSWKGVVVLVVSATVLLLLAGALFSTAPGHAWIAMEAGPAREAGRSVRLHFENTGTHTATVHLPWPENRAAVIEAGQEKRLFGVTVWVRERGERDFHMYPHSDVCWDFGSVPAPENNGFQLEHGVSVQAQFHLGRLETEGIDALQVRFRLTRGDGHLLQSLDVDVPEISAASARPAPLAGMPDIASAPQPPQSETLSPPPSAIATEQTGASSAETGDRGSPVWSVAFKGTIGNNAILAIREAADGKVESRSVAAGDTATGDWLVESIEASGAEVVLRNRYTGKRVTLKRGAGESPLPDTKAASSGG